MNLAFCHTISTIGTKPKTNPHEILAFNKTTTTTERNLQGSAPHIVQMRAIAQRYTCKSQTIKKAKTHAGESCRPVNPIYTFSVAFCICLPLFCLVIKLT